MAQQYTPEEFAAAQKAQNRKIKIGLIGLIVIIFFFAAYSILNTPTEVVPTSLVNKPKVDSINATTVVDKSQLYDAQREKQRKDSMQKLGAPKDDSVLKMVNTPIFKPSPKPADAPKPASNVIPKVKRDFPVKTISRKAYVSVQKRVNHKHTILSTAKPVVRTIETGDKSAFNFVYNTSNSPASKNNAVNESDNKVSQTSGYGNYSYNKRVETKPVLGRLIKSQKVEDGDAVGIKLLADLKLSEGVIKEGTVIFGKASMNGKRVNIQITNVKTDKGIISTSLQVLGDDMIQGVEATVKEPKVDASGAPSQAVSILTSAIGGVTGSVLGSIRPRSSNIQYRTFSLEAGKQVYITSN